MVRRVKMINVFIALLENPKHEAQFTEIYYENIDLLKAIAKRVLDDNYFVEDAVNIAMARTSLKFDKLSIEEEKAPGSIKAYLIESVKNTAINLVKAKNRQNKKVELISDFCYANENMVQELTARAEDHELYLEALAVINELPITQKMVLNLRFIYNMDNKEIASIMDIPIGTVKSRLSRGIEVLRKYFDVESLNN